MVKLLNKALEEVVSYIKNTEQYKKCIQLKKQMNTNSDIVNLISDIKTIQKDYVRSNYDQKYQQQLNILHEKLNQIPIYLTYMKNLEEVNSMIDYVKDELNDYFYSVFNG